MLLGNLPTLKTTLKVREKQMKTKNRKQKRVKHVCAKPSIVIAQAALIELPVGANYSAMCT